MDEKRWAETIRGAVDARLSGLRENPHMAQRVITQAKGEAQGKAKGKKKMSVGFVLLMALLLAAAGAMAAALLSLRDIVMDKAIPIANQYVEEERYTPKDTNRLVELAEANGIVLSEETKDKIAKSLAQGEGYFKEELLMDMAKAEFGQDPTLWTLEEQKWFDDVCVKIGFIPEAEKAMPTGRDITQETAVLQAQAYIHEHFDPDVNLEDGTVYQLSAQYLNGTADGAYDGNYWTIHYKPQTLEAAEYWLCVNSSGEVWDASVTLGVTDGTGYQNVENRYYALYGWDYTRWDHAVLQAFRASAERCAPSEYKLHRAVLLSDYPNIAPDAISAEKAAELGAQAIGFPNAVVDCTAYIGSSPHPIWKVTYRVDFGDGSCTYWFVEVDSITGAVLGVAEKVGGHLFRSIVLDRVYDEVIHWVDDRPGAG